MSSNGVVVRGDRLPAFRTIEEWGSGLRWLVGFNKNWRWILGEYLCKGEDIYGEKVWQFIDPRDIGFGSRQAVSNAMWTFRAIGNQYNPEAGLTFDTWRELASLEPAQRDPFITRALSGETIHRDEIRALAASRNVSNGTTARSGLDAAAGTGTSAIGTARDLAAENFGLAMAVCAKLMKYGDEDNLKEGLDDLIAKAMILRELL